MAANQERLLEAIRQLASVSVVNTGLPDLLNQVAVLANETVDGSDFVGMTMAVKGRVQTPVYTDEDAPEIDAAQYRTGVGPCVDAFRDCAMYLVPSTPEDERWKPFSEACVAHGVLSMMSLPVAANGESLGALNFYSRTERAFDADAEAVAAAFAAQAGVIIANARAYWDAKELGEQLTEALSTRVITEQAKGLLMSTGLSADAAFDVLKKASQSQNRKLRDVAADIVAEAERRAAENRS